VIFFRPKLLVGGGFFGGSRPAKMNGNDNLCTEKCLNEGTTSGEANSCDFTDSDPAA